VTPHLNTPYLRLTQAKIFPPYRNLVLPVRRTQNPSHNRRTEISHSSPSTMEPLSIGTSAAITSAKALQDTVQRYKDRNRTLGRLQSGLQDLTTILSLLKEATDDETPVLTLLKGLVGRCNQMCCEFNGAIETFSGKPNTGLKDWTKMEFMKGDINEFIDTLSDYKSAIATGLETLTMSAQQSIEEYNEMIQDTIYSLEIRLRRIAEKIGSVATDYPTLLNNLSVDLQEKAVIEQCLQVCELASSHTNSLQNGQLALQKESPRERLNSSNPNGGPDHEKLWLEEDIRILKQSLEVWKQVSHQLSTRKIHIIEEVTANEGGSIQIVVTTDADLFRVGKVVAKSGSAQLVGSIQADVLQDLLKHRYGGSNLAAARLNTAAASSQAKEDGNLAGPETT
jgi:hypothetical protein